MPFSYVGDYTATQAPSAAPGPGVKPTIVIPFGGELRTIESITQEMKALADFVAWQMTRGVYSMFGTGTDGNVSPGAGTTTLASGKAYNNLTLAGTTLKPSRFPVFVRDTLTIDAASVIQDNGNAGGNASGATPGNGGAALSAAALGGGAVGGNGSVTLVAGGAGGNATNSLGGVGAKGGDTAGVGGAGGTVAAPAAAAGLIYQLETFLDGHIRGGGSLTMLTGGAGGGGGQGAAGPKAGGGGGGGAPVVLVCARKIVCSGAGPHITAIGGAGGAGEPTGATSGGGGGGGGGLVLIMASEISGLVTSAAGGAGGASVAGFPGAVGGAGTVLVFQV